MPHQKYVERRGANHGLHVFLTIITCGLWAITGWPIAAAMGRKTVTKVPTYQPPPQAMPPQQQYYPPQQAYPPQQYGPPPGQYGPPPGATPPYGQQQPPQPPPRQGGTSWGKQ